MWGFEPPKMKTVKTTCEYCGKTREYRYRPSYEEPDYSTARNVYVEEYCDDKGCDCKLGKLKHLNDKIEIKKQCYNCEFEKDGCCTNKKELEDISSMFNITGNLLIKNFSKKCKYYKLSKELFDDFIKFI